MEAIGATVAQIKNQPRGLAVLFWYLKIYVLIISRYIQARMSYRLDFFISSLGMIAMNLPGVLGIFIVFRSIPNLSGWSMAELVFMYAFALLALCPMQIFFDNLWQLRWKLQDGSFIKYYFRPLNMLFYFVSEIIDLKGITQLILGFVLLFWASNELSLQWNLLQLLAFAGLLLSASLIMIGLMLGASSAAFWIVNSFSILSLFSRFRDYAKYPLTIYNTAFRYLFSTLIPIGFMSFYPVQWVLRPSEAGVLVWLTPIAGVASLVLGLFIWSRGVRSWGGTGT